MLQIQMYVDIKDSVERIVFREGQDRNGPIMTILLADQDAFASAFALLNKVGDSQLADGEFGRIDDTTNLPVATFRDEADANNMVESKGASYRAENEVTVDGFDWKVVKTGVTPQTRRRPRP